MERVIDPAIADLPHESLSPAHYLVVLYLVAFCFAEQTMRIGTMRCSFCRRPDAEVSKLVAGPWRLFAGRVYICDRCAAQTIQIMERSDGNLPQRETAPSDGRSLSAIVTPTA